MNDLVRLIQYKMDNVMPKIDDDKWDLFIHLLQFNLKSILIENHEIQIRFAENLVLMFRGKSVPLVKFKEINHFLNLFYTPFISMKIKYDGYWKDIFKLFNTIIINNEELFNSQNEIESLWLLFVKKFLISFVDYNKRMPGSYEECKGDIVQIFANVVMKGKLKYIDIYY